MTHSEFSTPPSTAKTPTDSKGQLVNLPSQAQGSLSQLARLQEEALQLRTPEALVEFEEQAHRLVAAASHACVAQALQAAVDSEAVQEAAAQLVQSLPRRYRLDEKRVTVNIRTSLGGIVAIKTPYYRQKGGSRRGRKPGLYPALVVLGIWDRCTPKLASDVSRAVAMLGSLEEARAHLLEMGIELDVKTIRSIAYRFAARARAAQQATAATLVDNASGRRVVVSIDGGRVRVRRKKRGRKTKKGRNRYQADWREPKLLIIYVVGEDGRPLQSWASIIDGTLRGPDALVALLELYLRQIQLNAAEKILFVADGARWIWTRLSALIARLALQPRQVLTLIDFYHAVQQLSDAAKLRCWKSGQRKRWITKHARLLRAGKLDRVIAALKELRQGRNAAKIGTHLRYFIRNRARFAYNRVRRFKLPMGSGAVESAIRRVINLRVKGPAIYWLKENVEHILLLRSFYKSRRWKCLQRFAYSAAGLQM